MDCFSQLVAVNISTKWDQRSLLVLWNSVLTR